MGEKNNIKMKAQTIMKNRKQLVTKKTTKIIKKNSQWPFWASVLYSAAGCVG